MISSVLVVCIGNICRSPVGEALLAKACPQLKVESAGLAAVVGHGADKTAQEVSGGALPRLAQHSARQFSSEIASEFDLILVMEKGHIAEIQRIAPEVSGKTMLYGQWIGQKDIPDPHRKSDEFHKIIFEMLSEAGGKWAPKLGGQN